MGGGSVVDESADEDSGRVGVTAHPRVLNLGCGTKAPNHPDVLNIDWSIHLRIRKNRLLWALRRQILDDERRRKIEALPENIKLWDLRKGIPFPDDSVEAVYHSHVIEHLDRQAAPAFVGEIRRVLKPGGIHRVAVPDLEKSCRRYMDHLAVRDAGETLEPNPDAAVAALIDQMVRTEAFGTSQRPTIRRFVENALLGSAAKRGQTHRWMYDRYSLPELLREAGFREAKAVPWNSSDVPGWAQFGFEVDDDGCEYIPDSLYVEAVK
jgi:SAM-dependent methyltransferase